ncbi:type III-A CRISPR-associated RAMP protein Csm3 (plasmid) [Fulvitalea axinellae]|uniref:CRISPR system Cms endoribonuclease Csm3 n=1 Tax=Fulvitalea axinellae TaxID=1182444 RepID=A0AAU9CLR9_9BACT|nr:type III-A CRISPR-associated RAMP protein Csm3 [Fulvitalea axinellae]
MSESNIKLNHKVIVRGSIRVVTGLHIGGSGSDMEIGGLDQNNIIKTAQGVPYIPGSSLKGKLRNMLAKATGSAKEGDEAEKALDAYKIFGLGAAEAKKKEKEKEGDKEVPKRVDLAALLRVRDAYLSNDSREYLEEKDLDFRYSEVKYENTINRVTGVANPRPLERVPAGAKFEFEMIYDGYDNGPTEKHLKTIAFAMELLELDSLGGSGSRGSGVVSFEDVKAVQFDLMFDKDNPGIEKNEEKDYVNIFKKINAKAEEGLGALCE